MTAPRSHRVRTRLWVAAACILNPLLAVGSLALAPSPAGAHTYNANLSLCRTATYTGINAGIYSGAAKIGTGRTVSLSTGSTTITSVSTGSGAIDYQINDASNNYRYGTMKYNKTGSVCAFDDEYSEPATALNANLFAHANGSVVCTTTGSYTLKYNIKQFV